jgi:methionine biosynthesis protein MetW
MSVLGRVPVTRALPYSWYNSPNRHHLSINDFREFCAERKIHIEQELALGDRGHRWSNQLWPNLFADEAVYVISRG